ncbi:MAG: 4Fe-4S binding protein, partial [Deltaproteobacteria bacterium]|nr:4Fe-4S binding protein [Deltaproteobacteria bacterium]
GWTNAFFWSSLFLMEIIMAGMMIYYIVRYPARRKRLITLSICHFSVILLLPTLLDDWSWTCLLYPWPHSFQVFDPATPKTAFAISLFVGFILVPFITYKWGARGFCGYLCPHGAFFSETYGRAFASHPKRLEWAKDYIPPIFFALMVFGLIVILFKPGMIIPIRSIQKFAYFFSAEFFYFVIGIPLIGGRSYCRLICPMGYFIRILVRLKRRFN